MAGDYRPITKAVGLGDAMRALVTTRLVGAFRVARQGRTIIVVTTAVIVTRLMLVVGLSINRRIPRCRAMGKSA